MSDLHRADYLLSPDDRRRFEGFGSSSEIYGQRQEIDALRLRICELEQVIAAMQESAEEWRKS